MSDEFQRRGHALEEAFFNKQSRELLAKLRTQEEEKQRKADLAAATGIEDASLLDELLAAGIEGSTLTALLLAPLVLMAWVEGRIETHERGAILRAAEERGLGQGTLAFQLIESWLDTRPSPALQMAWEGYVKILRSKLPESCYDEMRKEILAGTQRVARAAGGILGVLTVSKTEKALLAKIEAALG